MMIPPVSFSTAGLRQEDQFDAWHSFYETLFDVGADQSVAGGFDAEVRLWTFGHFAMSRTIAPPVLITRTKAHLRQDPVDHWVILYGPRGAHSAVTAGVSVEVPARVPYLWSLGQEFAHERTHMERIQLLLARDAFADIAPVLDAALGSALDTPLGLLLGDYMTALERHLPDLTEANSHQLRDSVAAMVSAAVAPTAERAAVARRQIDLGRMERVRQMVRRHLRTPNLQPKTLCRLVGMSRSNLYRLLEDRGGVAQYIQSQRLLEAHSILADPANARSITTLAEDFCFADASSFSRAFKREFGYPPSDARALARVGKRVAVPSRDTQSKELDFASLLNAF
jgi:AraC-like DNA-binding protein